jgi:pyruvate dehydrogenase E2 component (dihydrolipoamide acetyltransferase)
MIRAFFMPKLGVNMTSATVTEWLVQEGDRVSAGQTVLLAETDKAVQEVPVGEAGQVARLLVNVYDEVACQQPVLLLQDEGEAASREALDRFAAKLTAADVALEDAAPPVPNAPAAAPEVDSASGAEPLRISPLAKKTAQDLGVDVRLVTPSKPGARISSEDVVRYAESLKATETFKAAEENRADKVRLTGIRKLTADRMLESVLNKPQVALTVKVDARGLVAWREHSKQAGQEISLNEMLLVITAKALREHPLLNASIAGDWIEYHQAINIGLAIEGKDGLAVAVIRDTDRKSPQAIGEELREKISRFRAGRINLDDLAEGTMTITNLGMFEIEQFDAIINPPQGCILAVGAIVREPVVDGDAVVAGERMQLTLSFDHRLVDGALAARFLQRVKHLAEAGADFTALS